MTVAGEVTGEIGVGLLLLLGVGREDSEPNADYLAEKIRRFSAFSMTTAAR